MHVNSVKDVYCVDCAAGGSTGYTATPSVNVTVGIDDGPNGNQPLWGRFEEAAEDISGFNRVEAGGIFCQNVSGHCSEPYLTFLDSIMSADANHSPPALGSSGSAQSVSAQLSPGTPSTIPLHS